MQLDVLLCARNYGARVGKPSRTFYLHRYSSPSDTQTLERQYLQPGAAELLWGVSKELNVINVSKSSDGGRGDLHVNGQQFVGKEHGDT